MYELKVEGLSCGHCVGAVTRSVKEIDEGAVVDVDLGAQRVRVTTSAPLDEVRSAIVEAGYPVLSSSTVS